MSGAVVDDSTVTREAQLLGQTLFMLLFGKKLIDRFVWVLISLVQLGAVVSHRYWQLYGLSSRSNDPG